MKVNCSGDAMLPPELGSIEGFVDNNEIEHGEGRIAALYTQTRTGLPCALQQNSTQGEDGPHL